MNLKDAKIIPTNYFLYGYYNTKNRKDINFDVYFERRKVNYIMNDQTIFDKDLFYLYIRFKYTLIKVANQENVNKDTYIRAVQIQIGCYIICFYTDDYKSFCIKYNNTKNKAVYKIKHSDDGSRFYIYKDDHGKKYAVYVESKKYINTDKLLYEIRHNYDLCKLINHNKKISICSEYADRDEDLCSLYILAIYAVKKR